MKNIPSWQGSIVDDSVVNHRFYGRQGGVSTGFFSSLNTSFSKPDTAEKVFENRSKIAEDSGVPIHQFIWMHQTHS